MTTLSVIIPVLNEEHVAVQTIKDAAAFLATHIPSHELIVVVDGTENKTGEMVEKLKDDLPQLRTIHRDHNRGKGFTIREGILKAAGTYCVFLDADHSTTIDHILPALSHMHAGSDIVIGSRTASNALITQSQPAHKIALGKLGNSYIRLITGLQFTDTQCGFKVFTSDAAKRVFTPLATDRFAFDVEILMRARRSNLRITEIPVTWQNHPQSSVTFKGYLRALYDVTRIRFGSALTKHNEVVHKEVPHKRDSD